MEQKHPGLLFCGRDGPDGVMQMSCPHCGREFVHAPWPPVLRCEKHEWEHMRFSELLLVPMMCELGHYWILWLGNYKGSSRAGLRLVSDDVMLAEVMGESPSV